MGVYLGRLGASRRKAWLPNSAQMKRLLLVCQKPEMHHHDVDPAQAVGWVDFNNHFNQAINCSYNEPIQVSTIKYW
jgi:hypothetical protein